MRALLRRAAVAAAIVAGLTGIGAAAADAASAAPAPASTGVTVPAGSSATALPVGGGMHTLDWWT